MSDKITISASEYKKMQRDIAKLNALERGGVDNWEWFSESLSDWHKENAVDEFFDDAAVELHEYLIDAEVDQPAGQGCGYSITLSDKRCRDFFEWFIKKYKEVTEDDE